MNAVFKACLLAMLLVIALSSVAQADNLPAPIINDAKYPFLKTISGDEIIMMYNPATVASAQSEAMTVHAVHDDIAGFFGSYPYRNAIVVAGDNSEFRLFINVGDAPDTLKGLNWNVGYNGLIVVKSPAMLPDFKQVLTHQMARIAARTLLTNYKSMPEWYQDGVASYAADDLTQAERTAVTVKAATGNWMSLDEIEAAYKNMTIYNYNEQEYRDARAQAAALVGDIGSLYGTRTLVGIINDYTGSGNFSQAFFNRTAFMPDALNVAYMNLLAGNNNQVSKPASGTIEGFLRDADDRPVSGATVMLSGQGGNTSTITGADGHYAVNVTPGTYQVTVSGWATESRVKAEADKRVMQNMTLIPPPVKDSSTTSWPATGDILLYGLIAVVNAAGVILVLAILRRNWH
jgi:hypothetical protein